MKKVDFKSIYKGVENPIKIPEFKKILDGEGTTAALKESIYYTDGTVRFIVIIDTKQ